MENQNHPINTNIKPQPNLSSIDINTPPQTTNSPQSPNYKTPIIITTAIIVLGLIGCIAALFIPNGPLSIMHNQPNTPQPNNPVNQQTSFESLTKEEALAFLRSNTSVNGIIPKNYVDDTIINTPITNGNTIVSDLVLIHSYGDIEELKQLARREYQDLNFFYDQKSEEATSPEDNFEITEYDHYAIVTPNRIKGEITSCDHGYNSDCDSLLSFKKQSLDYREEETVSDKGYKSTTDGCYINTNLNPQIISQLLRIYSIVGLYSYNGHGNIYSYDFESQDDKYVLTLNIIGAGINMEMLNNAKTSQNTYNSNNPEDYLAINLYRRQFNVDKATGEISLTKTNDSTMDTVKSFSITQEEFNSLPFYGYSTQE